MPDEFTLTFSPAERLYQGLGFRRAYCRPRYTRPT